MNRRDLTELPANLVLQASPEVEISLKAQILAKKLIKQAADHVRQIDIVLVQTTPCQEILHSLQSYFQEHPDKTRDFFFFENVEAWQKDTSLKNLSSVKLSSFCKLGRILPIKIESESSISVFDHEVLKILINDPVIKNKAA